MRALIGLCAVLIGLQAEAASLRSMTTLHGPNVYVKDLFDDAGANAERLLGPGPDPGGRIIIESVQLNAIARQYDVPWRSISRADRAVLEWPGRQLRKEDAIEAVRLAITAAGAADDIDIDMPGFAPPVIPAEISPSATVSRLDYDSNTGRFTAILSITGESMNPIDTRVSGRAEAMQEAPITLTRLLPETVLRSDDVRMARVRTSLLRNEIARSPEQVVGMQLRRPIPAGQPLRLADLVRPPLVQRGATVQLELSTTGISVTGQAVALDDGADGDIIRVQNMTSRAFLFAQVTGRGAVRVTPDAPGATRIAPVRTDRVEIGRAHV